MSSPPPPPLISVSRMSSPALKQYGLFAIRDSGPPPSHPDYTTLFIFHGLQFHSATFNKLFPFVADEKVRLVTVNRPGYPGAAPTSDSERKALDDLSEGRVSDKELAAVAVLDHIKAGAKKVYDFLLQYVVAEDIPVRGGIVIAGWSLGAATVLGLLAYADDFATKDSEVSLRSYIKHVVLYDPPSLILGYPPPAPDFCTPFTDPLLPPEEIPTVFPLWVSGHYDHGEDLSHLRCRCADALPYPKIPTALAMDAAEAQDCMEPSALLLTGGSDAQVLILGVTLGVYSRLKEAALYLDRDRDRANRGERGSSVNRDGWDDVAIKYIWCDHSAWTMPWGAICFQNELGENTTPNGGTGRVVRKVEMVRLRGANHLYHWEDPGEALKKLLSGL